MRENLYNFYKKWDVIIVLSLYIFLSILLLEHYQYIINSDGISYISIAQRYLDGDFNNAINGYWGPLFSWLLVPFLFNVSNPLEAVIHTKIVSVVIGLFFIISVKFLLIKIEMDNWISIFVLFTLIPITLAFTHLLIFPDLLLTCLLIFYLSYIIDPDYVENWFNPLFCGFLGALAYLTKSYAFPFFLVHFSIFNLYYSFHLPNMKLKILKKFIYGMLVFLVLCGMWIALISDKYDQITIGTSSNYNYALVAPNSSGHYMYNQGLITPPNSKSVSSWEDPSYFRVKMWNPLDSMQSLYYQINLIIKNIIILSELFLSFSIFSYLILIFALFFLLKADNEQRFKKNIIYLILSILIYSAGYLFIIVEGRYLWFVYILMIILGFYILNGFFKLYPLREITKNILLIVLCLSFILSPLNTMIYAYDSEIEFYNLSKSLREDYNISGNIASDSEWEMSIYLVYYLNGTYYGQTKPGESLNDIKNELDCNNIDYYLVWNVQNNSLVIPGYEEITGGKIVFLKIYKKLKST